MMPWSVSPMNILRPNSVSERALPLTIGRAAVSNRLTRRRERCRLPLMTSFVWQTTFSAASIHSPSCSLSLFTNGGFSCKSSSSACTARPLATVSSVILTNFSWAFFKAALSWPVLPLATFIRPRYTFFARLVCLTNRLPMPGTAFFSLLTTRVITLMPSLSNPVSVGVVDLRLHHRGIYTQLPAPDHLSFFQPQHQRLIY